MEALHPGERLEVLDRAACMSLLEEADVGRLGFVVDGEPRIEPVNFRVVDGDILVATRAGAKVDAAAVSSRVAFEVDAVEEWARAGWSVLAVGAATLVTDADERAAVVGRAPRPWAPVQGLALIRIAVDRLTGRRVRVDPGGVSVVVQDPDVPRPD